MPGATANGRRYLAPLVREGRLHVVSVGGPRRIFHAAGCAHGCAPYPVALTISLENKGRPRPDAAVDTVGVGGSNPLVPTKITKTCRAT
jgi:hypothetical protein